MREALIRHVSDARTTCGQQSHRQPQGFGWAKAIGSIRQVMVRGFKKLDELSVRNMEVFQIGQRVVDHRPYRAHTAFVNVVPCISLDITPAGNPHMVESSGSQ